MIDFFNLKNSYISTIQTGLRLNAKYEDAKQGNELVHKFCESYIESSECSDFDKQNMKHELELVKETLSHEIERYFKNN